MHRLRKDANIFFSPIHLLALLNSHIQSTPFILEGLFVKPGVVLMLSRGRYLRAINQESRGFRLTQLEVHAHPCQRLREI
jgi:hypothetical protein